MNARTPRGRRSSRGRTALALVAVAAMVVISRMPLASAAFSATTANAGNSFAAKSVFCASGSVTITVTNDSMVQQQNPTSNYGSAAPISVSSFSNANKRVIVRPTLPNIPAGCTLQSAILRFRVTTFQGGRTYDAYRLASNWDVNSITWNNQPATVGSPSSAMTSNTNFDIEVVDQVSALIANGPGGNYGLLVRDSSENSAQERQNSYDSIDGSTPPLVIYSWA